MNSENGNAPAYPVADVIDHDRNFYQYGGSGLTKREAFAMAAMQGYLAAGWTSSAEARAAQAVAHADALLAELAKEPT